MTETQPAHNVLVRDPTGLIDPKRMRAFMYSMVDVYVDEVTTLDPYMKWPNLNSLAFDFATSIRCLHNAHLDEAAVCHHITDWQRKKNLERKGEREAKFESYWSIGEADCY